MKSLRIFTLFLSLASLAHAYAQEKYNSLTINAQWNPGNHFSYSVKKSTFEWEGSAKTIEDSIFYSAKFEILEKIKDGYIIRWTTEAIGLFPDISTKGKLYSLLKNSNKNISLLYKTGPDGAFQHFENLKDLLDLVSFLPEEKLSKEEILICRQILANPEEYTQKTLEEIQYFHIPMGLTFVPNQSLEYVKEIGDPKTDNLHEVVGSIYIDYIDYDYKICNIVQELSLDKITEDLILEDLQAPKENSSYSYFEDNYYEVLYEIGVPISIEIISVSKLDREGDIKKKAQSMFLYLTDDVEFQK